MLFVTKGKLMVNSPEYNGITLNEGQFVLHAMGAEMETLALTDVECTSICFSDARYICETSFIDIMDNMSQPLFYAPLTMNMPLRLYLEGFRYYIDEDKICNKFYQAKSLEIAYILSNYFSTQDLIKFFYPIVLYRNKFYDFVLNNYTKFDSLEDLARWGGYSLDVFLCLFKNIYKEPADEWIKRNKLDIHSPKKKITHEQTSQ